ncbi:MAG: PEP-CTERM/exosortase system-associated acyltransferase [Gammaproteobacteria bacterium]
MEVLNENIADKFKFYFDIRIVSNPAELDAIFQLRYDIFCKEFGFEKEEDCKNQREIDLYDSQGLHCLVLHKATKTPAGCVRILLPEAYPKMSLPFEQYCHIQKTNQYCEISRLAVNRSFRRRSGDTSAAMGMSSQTLEQVQFDTIHRHFPMVPVSLMLAGIAICKHLNRNIFAMMEPKLVHAMKGYGIHFAQVGKVVPYHGERAAFQMAPEEVFRSIHPELKYFLNIILNELRENTLKWEDKRYNKKIS